MGCVVLVGRHIASKDNHQWFILIMNGNILVMNTEGDDLIFSH